MIHIMMDINEHQDQRHNRGDNNGRDLYLLGVNVLVDCSFAKCSKSTTQLQESYVIEPMKRFLFDSLIFFSSKFFANVTILEWSLVTLTSVDCSNI